ncbi:Hsp70 family protein [Pontivivens insulae]|uniref:Chaperone protein DnaK n=1 Tax=Pontivivens insulae TaxID=1639689 RepID=A0A2R8A967_9RHOB|nr:Hsp70 family protein [Pontivivens insulae]RED12682.1 putative chaperone protein [Pontivivens insulae]SPF28773.1 Chaperone protein DnaK [Pontivivens insulae]
MPSQTLAIDFGTSNSAAAIFDGGRVRYLPIEGDAETLPTAVFFPTGQPMRIGAAASTALIDGEEGRYMRALKSVLGLPLLHESRMLGGRRQTLADVITAFLIQMRRRAEAETGQTFTRALSGRPVHFHTSDPAKDAQAEADLRGCYHAAGFDHVDFLPEPEAAVLAAHGMSAPGALGIIVDIGGGTSDFSIFRTQADGPEILASHGIRLGGTDFDRAVSIAHAMPLLGLGGQLRRVMGQGLLPVPHAPFVDLATWPKIPFLYTPEMRRMVADMLKVAEQPERITRFAEVLEHELGHELAFAVERGKIDANAPEGQGAIRMNFIELGLAAPLSRAELDAVLHTNRTELAAAMSHTLTLAGVEGETIDSVVLVGGSSLMTLVEEVCASICPRAIQHRANAFTAVIDGLARATAA